ncbi:beta family protein [Micromonospora okii]|uniref:beta family protein n=1 Tax=Micromonospora okii TaxID=1182970 RepID=UPI001E62907D|nr:beta family protein [Micromonospora okii]
MVPAHGGRAAEPVYHPVLACRRGELEALRHLDSAAAALLAPVLDVSTVDSPLVDALARLPAGLLPAVDVSALPDTADAELIRWGVPLVPVAGLAESDARLAAHGRAARAYAGRLVVRLRAGHDRSGPDATTAAVERIWRLARLVPEQCELLVDAGDVWCAADVRLAEPRVRWLVDWARRHAWRAVTVAAGGLPPTLSRLPTDEPVRLDRWDWLLWRRLADLGVGYGDYGVGCAVPGAEAAGDRLPTVRYATDGAWWVYRWSRRGGRGDERVADLCRTVVSAPHWPADGAGFSWGDHEILRRARGTAGAGSTANWAAWSTSHHLAHVLRELRRADESGPAVPPPDGGRRAGGWPGAQGRAAPRQDGKRRAERDRVTRPRRGGQAGWPG